MKAVLFDVYGTLLIGERITDRETPLREVVGRFELTFPEERSIAAELDQRIIEAHQRSDAKYPEVDIREIWQEIFPGLADPDTFAFEAENAVHSLRTADGARESILRLHEMGLPMGIVSNAQAYTRTLLRQHLGSAANCFDPDLCAFSYQHRIAKPDPAIFKLALDALQERGILPNETLMVGDSPSKDIEPASRLGLQTRLASGGKLRLP